MKDFRGITLAMRKDMHEEAILRNAKQKLRRVLPPQTFIDISTDAVPPPFRNSPREVGVCVYVCVCVLMRVCTSSFSLNNLTIHSFRHSQDTHTHTHTGPFPPHPWPPYHAPSPRQLERGTSDMVAGCMCANEARVDAGRLSPRRETEQRERNRRRRRRERPAFLYAHTFLLSPPYARLECFTFLP